MIEEHPRAVHPPHPEAAGEGRDRADRPLPIHILAEDPVSRAGVAAQLAKEGLTAFVAESGLRDGVVVVVADRLDGDVAGDVARLRRLPRCPMVLIAQHVDDAVLLRATELGFAGIVRRRDATAPMLAGAVRAVARGDGTLPPDLIGRLLGVVERLHSRVLAPEGLTASGLTERELRVLRLVADGMDTAQIAVELSYSERTIKDILHQLTSRLQLRNRTHAVAFAMREGLL